MFDTPKLWKPENFICPQCGSILEILYRWSKESDLKEIKKLLGKLPKNGIELYINSFIVTLGNGKIVGCMGSEIHYVKNDKYAVLRSLKVKREFRRKHIATNMFSIILNNLRERDNADAAICFTLSSKMANLVRKFSAVKISKKHAYDHIDKIQPSEASDPRLSKNCQAWLIPIPK